MAPEQSPKSAKLVSPKGFIGIAGDGLQVTAYARCGAVPGLIGRRRAINLVQHRVINICSERILLRKGPALDAGAAQFRLASPTPRDQGVKSCGEGAPGNGR